MAFVTIFYIYCLRHGPTFFASDQDVTIIAAACVRAVHQHLGGKKASVQISTSCPLWTRDPNHCHWLVHSKNTVRSLADTSHTQMLGSRNKIKTSTITAQQVLSSVTGRGRWQQDSGLNDKKNKTLTSLYVCLERLPDSINLKNTKWFSQPSLMAKLGH